MNRRGHWHFRNSICRRGHAEWSCQSMSFRYHKGSELLEDMVIPLLVRFAKIASVYGLPDFGVIDIPRMGFQCEDEIPYDFLVDTNVC